MSISPLKLGQRTFYRKALAAQPEHPSQLPVEGNGGALPAQKLKDPGSVPGEDSCDEGKLEKPLLKRAAIGSHC